MPSIKVFIEFFRSQLFESIPYPTERCDGKFVVVTGANTGLGKEAARHFVRLGAAKVIIACRTTSKGEEAKRDIEQTESRPGAVEVWSLDLLDYDSVKAFAKRLDTLPRLDILIENAGISTEKFVLAGGNESTITTNVVSTFLLALLALPILKRTAQKHSTSPVLTIVSSEVHEFTDFNERHASSIFDALNDPQKAIMGQRYFVSKLLEVFVVRELCAAELPADYPVTINYINPGFCHSGLAPDTFVIRAAKALLARTTEIGARTLVFAGLGSRETHGQYMTNGRIRAPGTQVTTEEGKMTQTRVWRELSQKLDKIQPGVLQDSKA